MNSAPAYPPAIPTNPTSETPAPVTPAAGTSPVVLETRALCKSFSTGDGALNILKDIALTVTAGETLAILGASGSGKSTLLALLAGLDVPTSGEVWLDGACISALDEDARAQIRARAAGFVFQSFHLLPAYTALENVMLPLELQGVTNAGSRARAALEEVGLGARLDHRPSTLSGGEQQRVALARALVTQPRILFADEPTGNLDVQTGTHIMDLLFELNRRHHTTLVLVTHDAVLAARCGRQVRL